MCASRGAAASSAGVMGLADALVADGDLGGAAHELEQWLTRHADDLEATQALALLYLRLQRLPRACGVPASRRMPAAIATRPRGTEALPV